MYFLLLTAKNLQSTKISIGLTISAQVKTVLAAPGGTTRSSDGLSVTVSLAQAARALASRGESAQLAMLLNRVADPVDLGVAANSVVVWIDANDLEVLVGGILSDPVGVQNTESTHATTNTFLKIKNSAINVMLRKH